MLDSCLGARGTDKMSLKSYPALLPVLSTAGVGTGTPKLLLIPPGDEFIQGNKLLRVFFFLPRVEPGSFG